jgi:hypothetical protein
VRSYFWPFTEVQNGNRVEVMRKVGFAALNPYGGATRDSADFTVMGQTKVELTDAVSRRYAWVMSVEELKKTVATLSPGEQNELTAFLFHLRHRGDVAYQAMLKGRVDDKDPSHWLTPEEFEKRLDAE